MKYAGVIPNDTVDVDKGLAVSFWVQGCPHHCPGCHNKEAQDFNYGEEFNEEEILERIKENSILNGITISGGEPLCMENIKEVSNFIKEVKKVREKIPTCKLVMLCDENSAPDIAREVANAKKDGLIDAFFYSSVTEKYLTAALASL